MPQSLYLPVTDSTEIQSLLEALPIAVDRPHFTNFVLGFPRKYLISTPKIEIVKHYVLMETLGTRQVITSLAREGQSWKLCVITPDRRYLFARIAGTLSYFGMNILSAEAFANAHALVLDTFYFIDRENRISQGNQKQNFQHVLEEIIQGKLELEPLLKSRWSDVMLSPEEKFEISFDNDVHPSTTRLTLDCGDHFGLLYLISRCISDQGCNIEMAYIETPGGRAHDQFFLSKDGGKLHADAEESLKARLLHLGERMMRVDRELI
ncbi:MAG: hypothetical protein HY645_02330 [Acidobacteria bacterium]|nr:hypothetical protein [Acidobacteriota bacterium]